MSEGPELDVKRCAKCAAWIPATATMCAYCNSTDPDQPLARPRGTALSLRHGYSATTILIAANVAYFLFSLFVQHRITPDGNPLQWALTGRGLGYGLGLAGAYGHGEVFVDHEWWRVLCATFLHFGGIHLAMNMFALKQLGDLAESLFGPAKFVTVYVISGVGSCLAVSIWYAGVRGLPAGQFPGLVGASGAIFGVAGLLIVYLLRAGTERSRAIAGALGRNILGMLVIGYFVPIISQVGHVGGLIPGLAFGLVMKGEFGKRLNMRSQSSWSGVALVLILAAVASLVAGAWFAFKHMGGT